MILGNDICLSFGTRALFDNLAFSFSKTDKIGFVGRNGAGKSTLLKVIAGRQALDKGGVSIEKDKHVAYMPQEMVLESTKSILEETFSAFERVYKLQKEIDSIEQQLGDADEHMLERYAHLQHEMADYNIADLEQQAKKVLQGLGFSPDGWDKPVNQLSVGWKMRVVLAKLLLQDADFYLFDEPTNHLDIFAKDWFLDFLKHAPFGFLLVTHDRYCLDYVCQDIFHIDRGKGKLYRGNYSSFLGQQEHEQELLEKAYATQQKEIAQKKRTAERFRAKATKAKMAQGLLRSIEKMEIIELEQKQGTIKLNFGHIPRAGKTVLKVKDVSKRFGDQTVFKNISFDVDRGQKVALVAANGVGKTTLLNVVTGKYPLEYGSFEFGYNVTHALFEQDQDLVLDKKKTILEEAESACQTSQAHAQVRTFLGTFLFPGDDVHKKIGVLSGGEKNRVAMVKVLLQHANFLILDEPTNHLDLQSKEILLTALQQFSGTILFVSHDRTFLNELATVIVELTPTKALTYQGNYDSFLHQKEMTQPKASTSEKKATPKQKEHTQQKKQQSSKQAYELNKKINNLESKIDRYEQELSQLYEQLGLYDYSSTTYQETMEKIEEIKNQHSDALTQWEALHAQLGDK
ncbi:MAG: ABC-F family ATP-binding cassette domain-containing protein [Epsilonproteobacteria bacterium]|nr:ABC-F family ATP-binding cassette domain-containing protein [Campylobacterota bacterium]